MSGRKRIYVDEAEWNRLRGEAGRLSELRRDVPRLIDQVREQTRADLDRAFGDLDRRQDAVERDVSALSERNRRFEQETTRRLQDNARQLRRQLEDNTRVLRAETSELLAKQREEVRRAVAEERRERERHVAALRADVEVLQRDKERAAALEAEYLADAGHLRDAIAALPHERFAPDALGALERRLRTAESAREQGVTGYGLGNAQHLYHEFSDLRVAVLEQDGEWTAARGAAVRALRAVEGLIGQNEVMDLDPVPPGGQPDVDYWSRGALSRLRGEVAALLERVRDESTTMTTEDFRSVVDRSAAEFEERLETVVRQAGTAVYASQLRTNFADLVATALETHHQYDVRESTFEGEDQREAFYAKGSHLDGSEIVIEVEPTGQDGVECAVRVLSYDEGTPSAEERGDRVESIRRSLRDNGIAVGRADEDGRLDPADRDLDRVRRRTPDRRRAS